MVLRCAWKEHTNLGQRIQRPGPSGLLAQLGGGVFLSGWVSDGHGNLIQGGNWLCNHPIILSQCTLIPLINR